MMSDAKLTVDAGACRFITTVAASPSDDLMTVRLTITSDCPNVKRLAEDLREADVIETVGSGLLGNPVMKKCDEFIPHPACPVPCAVVKAAEVASEQAVRREVTIRFEWCRKQLTLTTGDEQWKMICISA